MKDYEKKHAGINYKQCEKMSIFTQGWHKFCWFSPDLTCGPPFFAIFCFVFVWTYFVCNHNRAPGWRKKDT